MTYILCASWGIGVVEALACGSALASTGIGFILSLMKDLDLLATPLGQLVAAAAMIDDVSSMVLLAVLQSIETGEANALVMMKPVVASLGLFLVSIILRTVAVKILERKQVTVNTVSNADENDKVEEHSANERYLHE